MKQIRVVAYDAKWMELFETAAAEIASALGENLIQVHHVGSTSISGIFAKPVIDMLGVVADMEAVDLRTAQMEALGYQGRGEFGIPGRRYFCRDNAAGERTHQLHAFQVGSAHIHRHLVFRDFLRAHSAFAEQYADLKRGLAERHRFDLNAYMDGKDDFIQDMEAKAFAWDATGRPVTS